VRLKNIYGRYVSKNVSKYLIDWDGECRSKVQFNTKQFLKQYWSNNIVYEEFPVYGSKMKVDILNATTRVAVEVQGKQHYAFNKHFHGNSRMKYLQAMKRDVKKLDWLEMNNFIVVEIKEEEVPLLTRKFFEDKFGVRLY
jgi:hypothetical protein